MGASTAKVISAKAIGDSIFDGFYGFFRDNIRPEVDSDVISGVDVRVQFDDSWSNGSRDTRLLHFVTDDDTAMTNDTDVRRLSYKAETFCLKKVLTF